MGKGLFMALAQKKELGVGNQFKRFLPKAEKSVVHGDLSWNGSWL
jgi:hypothetical protein